MKRMIIPSKANLQRDAQPLERIRLNKNIRTLVVDRTIRSQFSVLLRDRKLPRVDAIEFTDHACGVIIALDADGQFCGSYSLPGAAPQTPTAAPVGQGTSS